MVLVDLQTISADVNHFRSNSGTIGIGALGPLSHHSLLYYWDNTSISMKTYTIFYSSLLLLSRLGPDKCNFFLLLYFIFYFFKYKKIQTHEKILL